MINKYRAAFDIIQHFGKTVSIYIYIGVDYTLNPRLLNTSNFRQKIRGKRFEKKSTRTFSKKYVTQKPNSAYIFSSLADGERMFFSIYFEGPNMSHDSIFI